MPAARVFADEALSFEPLALDVLEPGPRRWADLRVVTDVGRGGSVSWTGAVGSPLASGP